MVSRSRGLSRSDCSTAGDALTPGRSYGGSARIFPTAAWTFSHRITSHAVAYAHYWPRHLVAQNIDDIQPITGMVVPRGYQVASVCQLGGHSTGVPLRGSRSLPSLSSLRTDDMPWLATSAIQTLRTCNPRCSELLHSASQNGSYNSCGKHQSLRKQG